MKASKLAIFAIVALALLAACGHQVASLPNEPPASDRDIAEHHAMLAGGRKMEPTPSERFDIAVVGGTCAPKVTAKFAVTACVDEKPCNGHGLRIAGGDVVCACYEVRGGCASGTFCNRRSRTCMKLPEDPYHAQ